jgi:two-component system, chemotaxis family, sensor histidine kinase and response regulator WspE
MIPGDPSMFELFREEVRAHAETLSRGLLEIEADPENATKIEPLMRAAHSIKGASRIVRIDLGVRLAHVMEDVLVAAQRAIIRLRSTDVDALLEGADILAGLADLTPDGSAAWENAQRDAVSRLEPVFAAMAKGVPVRPTEPATVAVAPEPEIVADTPVIAHNAPAAFPPARASTPAEIPTEALPLAPEHSMLDLFREELRAHLLLIGTDDSAQAIEALKQIRGAARIVKCAPVEFVAVAVSGFLSGLHERRDEVTAEARGWLSHAVTTLAGAVATDDETFPDWLAAVTPGLAEIARVFEEAGSRAVPSRVVPSIPVASEAAIQAPAPTTEAAPIPPAPASASAPAQPEAPSPAAAVVRVSAQSLTRLMGLAGESLVQARWLPSFSTALLALKKQHDRLSALLDGVLQSSRTPPDVAARIADARRQAAVCLATLVDKSSDFEDHAARAEDLNARLYREVIVSRMRPFGDGVRGLPRMVRDMARTLVKSATLVLLGEQTEVDRDILEKLESPLSHLVRNALDHGIEPSEDRTRAGKPATGTIHLEARHRAGMLLVTIADDGGGVDLGRLRRKIVDRGLNSAEMVARMTEGELLEFLFLPGFTTTSAVTEFSGRGVGLDVVQDTVRKAGGSVRVTTQPGRGTTFHLQLPLTLSVIRAVVVDVAGEPYAFPHTRIDRLIRVPRGEVRSLEHRQFATVDGQHVGLVVAAQLLDLPVPTAKGDDLAVVLLSDTTGTYGLVVDSFRGEQDLVVRPLDPRLGKVPNLSAAAILDDGSPVLIVDAEDLIRSMDHYIQTGVVIVSYKEREEDRLKGLEAGANSYLTKSSFHDNRFIEAIEDLIGPG